MIIKYVFNYESFTSVVILWMRLFYAIKIAKRLEVLSDKNRFIKFVAKNYGYER